MIKSIKTKLLTGLVLLLLTMACTACHSQNDGKPVNSATSVPSVNYSGQHLQRQLDTNFNVDADVVAPVNLQKLDTLLVTPIKFNTKGQALKTMLLGNSKVIKQENFENNGGTRYRTADGKDLFIDNVSVDFQTNKYSKYICQMLGSNFPAGITIIKNLDRLKQKRDRDLPFMTHQQAIDKVKNQLISLGISVDDEVETYALDHQTLQILEKDLKESGELTNPKDGSLTLKDGWNKDDDCYFLVFKTGFDKIPVYPESHGSYEANTLVHSAYIRACYSQRGLEYLSTIYSYQKKAVDQKGLKIINLDEALAAVKHKYGNVILSDPLTITSIEFNYVPMLINQSRDELRLVPAWCFELKKVMKDGEGKQNTFNIRMIIDATTGGEIL